MNEANNLILLPSPPPEISPPPIFRPSGLASLLRSHILHSMSARTAVSHLSVRNVPRELILALQAEQRRQGTSLNRTVIDVLTRGLGLDRPPPRTNGLERLAGGWSPAEHERFEEAMRPFGQIDEELWR